jgi:uncharacterized protein YneF (UPF0154 family)
MIVFMATNLNLHNAVAFLFRENIVITRTVDDTNKICSYGVAPNKIFNCKLIEIDNIPENDTPSNTLDEMLKKDAKTGGVIQNVLSGLAICYHALANLLLYPIFSFLLLALSLGAILLGGIWVKKIKNEQSISASWIICNGLYFLFYLDLFLVVFQKKKVLCLCLELEKDFLLIIVSALIGYLSGKFFSNKLFKEKELP